MRFFKLIAGAVIAFSASVALAQPPTLPAEGALPASDPLHRTIAALDARLFGAFNACDGVAMRELMEPGLEFYQDNDDSTFSRDQLELSQRLRCQDGRSRISRELSSTAVYPLRASAPFKWDGTNFIRCRMGREARSTASPSLSMSGAMNGTNGPSPGSSALDIDDS